MAGERLWCDTVRVAATGKVQDVFDSVGTVTLKIGVNHVLGIMSLVGNSIPTSGENGAPVLRIDSKDLDISSQEIQLTGAISDGIGTNDKESPIVAQYIPFMTKKSGALDNAEIDLSISSTTTTTGGWDAAIGILMSDKLPDVNLGMELMSGSLARATGGAVAYQRAGISAATATSFTTGPRITSRAGELVGLCGYVNPNAPTADEAAIGSVEFQASQIPDFAPQIWPFIVGWDASLGTPVGTQANVNLRNGVYWPTRFPLPKKNFNMSVSMTMSTALTNASDGIAGALWRE